MGNYSALLALCLVRGKLGSPKQETATWRSGSRLAATEPSNDHAFRDCMSCLTRAVACRQSYVDVRSCAPVAGNNPKKKKKNLLTVYARTVWRLTCSLHVFTYFNPIFTKHFQVSTTRIPHPIPVELLWSTETFTPNAPDTDLFTKTKHNNASGSMNFRQHVTRT